MQCSPRIAIILSNLMFLLNSRRPFVLIILIYATKVDVVADFKKYLANLNASNDGAYLQPLCITFFHFRPIDIYIALSTFIDARITIGNLMEAMTTYTAQYLQNETCVLSLITMKNLFGHLYSSQSLLLESQHVNYIVEIGSITQIKLSDILLNS